MTQPIRFLVKLRKNEEETELERTVKIINETGLHARPASLLAKTATQFISDINIEFQDNIINAKSIINILSAGLQKDAEIKIVAAGPDENEAINALSDLINSKFGEKN